MSEFEIVKHAGAEPGYSAWIKGTRTHTYAYSTPDAAFKAAKKGNWAVRD